MSESVTSGARGRLDRESIVAAVMELAKSEPQVSITYKRLGAALGVDPSAMYRHFRNKQELTLAALDRIAEMAVTHARSTAGDWIVRLESYLGRLAQLAVEYPSLVAESALLDPVGPGDVSADELLLELLAESGLRGEGLMRAYAAVSGFAVLQSAALAREEMLRDPQLPRGRVPWIRTFGGIDLRMYPNVDAHRDELLGIDAMTVFRAGAVAVIEAVERWSSEVGESAQLPK